MNKANIIAQCFPPNSERFLIEMICDFSESRTVDFFREKFEEFCHGLLTQYPSYLSAETAKAKFIETLRSLSIPLGNRIAILCDLLDIEDLNPIEQHRFEQFLCALSPV